MLLIVPAHPLSPRQPDEHFAPEFEAARARGLDVAVVDHDAIATGSPPDGLAAALRRVPPAELAVYRGWMLRGEQYRALARALAERGVQLLTSPAAYRRAHELPGWYGSFRDHTPRSTWTEDASLARLVARARGFGVTRAVLRDYVKSAKHAWDEAAHIPDAAGPDTVARVGRRLLEVRGEDFVGGFVLRAHEPFTGAEVRTWWVRGACELVTAHPDTPEATPPQVDTTPFAAAVAALDACFVTVDLAQRADGGWRVVEVGDGQVSDRPVSTPPERLLAALAG